MTALGTGTQVHGDTGVWGQVPGVHGTPHARGRECSRGHGARGTA